MASELPPRLTSIETEVRDIFRILTTGFQRIDRIKNAGRRGNQLEELTARMREAKRLIKEFDKEMQEESKSNPESHKLLNETKQSMIKELNSFVSLRKRYTSSIGNRQELLDGGSHAGAAQDVDVRVASTLSNQELVQTGRQQMDETDETIERSRKVVEETIHIGAETTTTLKGQTEQVGRITNELDTIQFSLKKATQLVKETGRQLATDKCVMFFLLLITAACISGQERESSPRLNTTSSRKAITIHSRGLAMTSQFFSMTSFWIRSVGVSSAFHTHRVNPTASPSSSFSQVH